MLTRAKSRIMANSDPLPEGDGVGSSNNADLNSSIPEGGRSHNEVENSTSDKKQIESSTQENVTSAAVSVKEQLPDGMSQQDAILQLMTELKTLRHDLDMER